MSEDLTKLIADLLTTPASISIFESINLEFVEYLVSHLETLEEKAAAISEMIIKEADNLM